MIAELIVDFLLLIVVIIGIILCLGVLLLVATIKEWYDSRRPGE